MTLGQHQQAFSRDLAKLLIKGFELGYEARIGEVLRTPEQQAIYVQTGRSNTMNSLHLKKCAADIHWFDQQGRLCYPAELGQFWESLSSINKWGGNWNFKDEPHYQRTV